MAVSGYTKAIALFFAACLVLGGGTRPGFLADAILQFAAVPVLCWTLYRLPQRTLPKGAGWVLLFAAMIAALPIIQLIPLPAQVWQRFPTRSAELEVLALAGSSVSSMPITVSVGATILTGLAFLPSLAVGLAAISMSAEERRLLSLVFIALSLANAFLGLVQLSQGPNSALRFYEFTNVDDAVGFFANRNHLSAMLNAAIVFTAAWTLDIAASASRRGAYKSWRTSLLIAGGTAIIVLVGACVMARSRAGVGITGVALLASVALATKLRRGNSNISAGKVLLGMLVFAVFLATQYGLYRIVDRFAADPLKDMRATFARVTLAAIKAFFPFGSGLGTFTRVYPLFEKPEQTLVNSYVNRAHNDLLEFVLETGVVGGVLLAVAALIVIVRTWDAWTQRGAGSESLDASLVRAATIALGLIALHSLFDYPMRTTAIAAIAALAFAMQFPARGTSSADELVAERRNSSAVPSERPRPAPESASASPVAAPRKAWGEDVTWPEEWRRRDTGKPQKKQDT